jgi:hypothetical protein
MTDKANGASDERGRRSRLARAGLLALALAAVAALGLLASACGGSSGEGVAQADSTQTTTADSDSPNTSKRDALVAFAACMRENGVPDFPDPVPSGGGLSLSTDGVDADSPRFKAAEEACQKLLPNGGQQSPEEQAEQLQEALEYSACMRQNGVPNFPDPTGGDGGIRLNLPRGLDSDSPAFKAAANACRRQGQAWGGDLSTTGP